MTWRQLLFWSVAVFLAVLVVGNLDVDRWEDAEGVWALVRVALVVAYLGSVLGFLAGLAWGAYDWTRQRGVRQEH